MDSNEIRSKMLGLKHECTYCVLCIRVERMVSVYDSIKKITADITELVEVCPEMMTSIAPILQKVIAYQQSGNMSQLADVLEDEIKYYVEKYKPMDKAGAYGVQEWFGYVCIEYIKGSFYNVMGLPTRLLWEMLDEIMQHTSSEKL